MYRKRIYKISNTLVQESQKNVVRCRRTNIINKIQSADIVDLKR